MQSIQSWRSACLRAVAVSWVAVAGAVAADLRIVNYNISADVGAASEFGSPDGTPDSAAVRNVFAALGNYRLAGDARPADVISLQELYRTPATTLGSVVNDLNAVYGAGTYAFAAGVSSGSAVTGNGPSGLIYNTKTVSVTGFTRLGTAGGQGAARTPVRYTLQPVGYGASAQFYLYNQHAKAGAGAADGDTLSDTERRRVEFALVRANADALGPDAHVVYTGDFNFVLGAQGEAGYQALTGPGGPGRAVDLVAPNFVNSRAAFLPAYTFSSTVLASRLDFQLTNAAALPGSQYAGLQMVANTYTAFGHTYYNGTTLTTSDVYRRSIAAAADNGTGLSQLTRTYLTQLSDHLPVVTDYVIAVPEPGAMAVVGVVIGVTLRRRRAAGRRDACA